MLPTWAAATWKRRSTQKPPPTNNEHPMPGEVSAAAVQLASAHSPAAESDTSSQFPPDHPLRVHPKMLGELSRHLTKDELTEELSNRSKSGPLSADAAVDINKRAAKSRYGDRTSVKARAKAATAALGAHYSADARQKQWVHHALKSKDWRVRLAVFCDEPSSSPQAFVFAVLVALMVLAQVFLIFFETGSFGASPNLDTTEKVQIGFGAFFTLELVIRTTSKTTWRQLFQSIFWWIDFLSIAPFYLDLVLTHAAGLELDDSILSVFQLLRILRLLKILRHYPDTAILVQAMAKSTQALIVPLIFLFLGAIFFGAAIFYFENIELGDFDPDAGTTNTEAFPDVGTGVWFMIVTFTTVGYGDTYPQSHVGRCIAIVAILCGVIFMAMPLAIVGSNFSTVWEQKQNLRIINEVQTHFLNQEATFLDIMMEFHENDVVKNGVLTFHEFKQFTQKLELKLTASEQRNIFRIMDEGSTNSITFFEFCHFIFPDLDVEDLAAKGLIEADLFGTPRLIRSVPSVAGQVAPHLPPQIKQSKSAGSSPSMDPLNPRPRGAATGLGSVVRQASIENLIPSGPASDAHVEEVLLEVSRVEERLSARLDALEQAMQEAVRVAVRESLSTRE